MVYIEPCSERTLQTYDQRPVLKPSNLNILAICLPILKIFFSLRINQVDKMLWWNAEIDVRNKY